MIINTVATSKILSNNEKIEKAEAAVIAAKARYDAALDELKRLVEKRKEMDDKKALETIRSAARQQMRL